MIKEWNGALWKISMTHNYVRLERFSQRKGSDFPYSVVEAEPCKLVSDPEYDPTETTGDELTHRKAGRISMEINNMVDLFKLICQIAEHGKDV